MKRLLIIFGVFAYVLAYFPQAKLRDISFENDAGPKLMMTKFIKEGKIQEARNLSLVTGIMPNTTSYAGFFTVEGKKCDSNFFFWFFPSQSNPSKDPVTIWITDLSMQSTINHVLGGYGPFYLHEDDMLKRNLFSLTRNSSIIFTDNLVGGGYSYTDDDACYVKDHVQIGKNVLNILEQFFQIFSEYKSNDFYVFGQSLAGLSVTSVAYAIHNSSSKINLKGIGIGNGLIDLENQLMYSDFLFHHGWIDETGRRRMEMMEESIRKSISAGLVNATSHVKTVWDNIITVTEIQYNNLLGESMKVGDVVTFITQQKVRQALHTGNSTWHLDLSKLELSIFNDLTRSVRPWLDELLEHYRVLVYNNQEEVLFPYSLAQGYLQKLKWSGANEFQNATRKEWFFVNSRAGFVKSAGNLTEVVLCRSFAKDRPFWGRDMYMKFIYNQPITCLMCTLNDLYGID